MNRLAICLACLRKKKKAVFAGWLARWLLRFTRQHHRAPGSGLLLAAFLVITVFARESVTTKLVLIVLGLILALPLLWAPVLAVVLDAGLTKTSIEYSNAYAGFRIIIGRLLFPATQAVFGGDLVSVAWVWFQGVATVIGFIAAVSQVWPMMLRMMGAQPQEG